MLLHLSLFLPFNLIYLCPLFLYPRYPPVSPYQGTIVKEQISDLISTFCCIQLCAFIGAHFDHISEIGVWEQIMQNSKALNCCSTYTKKWTWQYNYFLILVLSCSLCILNEYRCALVLTPMAVVIDLFHKTKYLKMWKWRGRRRTDNQCFLVVGSNTASRSVALVQKGWMLWGFLLLKQLVWKFLRNVTKYSLAEVLLIMKRTSA